MGQRGWSAVSLTQSCSSAAAGQSFLRSTWTKKKTERLLNPADVYMPWFLEWASLQMVAYFLISHRRKGNLAPWWWSYNGFWFELLSFLRTVFASWRESGRECSFKSFVHLWIWLLVLLAASQWILSWQLCSRFLHLWHTHMPDPCKGFRLFSAPLHPHASPDGGVQCNITEKKQHTRLVHWCGKNMEKQHIKGISGDLYWRS